MIYCFDCLTSPEILFYLLGSTKYRTWVTFYLPIFLHNLLISHPSDLPYSLPYVFLPFFLILSFHSLFLLLLPPLLMLLFSPACSNCLLWGHTSPSASEDAGWWRFCLHTSNEWNSAHYAHEENLFCYVKFPILEINFTLGVSSFVSNVRSHFPWQDLKI